MLLYHGTTRDNGKNIIKHQSFNLDRTGENWGTTYGKGVYLTPNIEEAKKYGDMILVIECEIKQYKLSQKYSPNDRKHKKTLKKIIRKEIEEGDYDSLVTVDEDEYILFKPEECILEIKQI